MLSQSITPQHRGISRMKALRTAAIASLATLAVANTSARAELPDQAVEIRFDARVGDQPARCDMAYSGIGSSKADMRLQDLRIYVSNLRLIGAEGNAVPVALTPDGQWQNDHVVLLDFEDRSGNCNGNGATNMVVRGTVPAGDYDGLLFEIGVPVAVNHQDPTLADAPLNVTAMTWPWRIGYKFIGIDIESSPADQAAAAASAARPGAATGFSIHLGSTDCGDGNPMSAPQVPCANGNRPTYRLAGFDPAGSTVILDLAALLAGTDITVNAAETASGCMSFPGDSDCIAIFDRLGLAFGGQPSAGQQWVRAE
ncbi:MAG: MbnP family copper-binding protein [Pseudomonadota bacterium]